MTIESAVNRDIRRSWRQRERSSCDLARSLMLPPRRRVCRPAVAYGYVVSFCSHMRTESGSFNRTPFGTVRPHTRSAHNELGSGKPCDLLDHRFLSAVAE